MSKNVAVFVDVANLYYSARGQEVDVDYVALLKAATKGRDLIRAYAYSGLDPENENQRKFIDFLNKNGYKVVHKDIRKFGDGRVKANLDIELVVDMFRLANRMDIAVVVSGDGDFAAAIRALQENGVRCEVISFRPNTSSDLIAVADEFIDIMKIASIGRGKKGEVAAAKGMSAPEMPAKEVEPAFAFREASPSVAAAALAALREGKNGRPAGRSSGGRGRRGATATPADETSEPAATTAVAPDEQANGDGARRRRRRRGGRGRGRGGHVGNGADVAGEGSAEHASVEPAEIGWTEVDDISQIDELAGIGPLTDDSGEEREYGFEEADEATLAELGMLGSAAVGEPADVANEASSSETAPRARTRTRKPAPRTEATGEDEPAAKPARRSRARKASPDASSAGSGSAESEPTAEKAAAAKPRARRSRTAATAGKDTGTAEAPAAEKPARRTRARKSGAPAGGDGTNEGADEQGIWQRFRSARSKGGNASS
ncbi:MAG TPA: NYN domain-containing protein [Candidatus Limnocylindria bacterium]|nr:NYN domain-containing protein [Candidatus Limnocylindria bacterium]